MAEFDPEYVRDFEDDIDKGEENIPIDDFTETSEETETLFSNLPGVPETGSDIREIQTKKAEDAFYKLITDYGWNVDRNALIENGTYFELDPKTKQVYVKYSDIQIRMTSWNNPKKILMLETIRQRSSVAFVRDVRGG